MKVIVSISGGKDSTFALYKAIQRGYEVAYLANTISDDFKRVRFHGVKGQVIRKQAKALGIPLLQTETSEENYRRDYIENIEEIIKKEGIEGLVLGDIFLEDCFDWAKGICDQLGIELIEPLWKSDPEQTFKEFIEDIKKLINVDICGENGEYHSLVLNGPIFKKKLEIKVSKKVLINGYWF